MRVCVFSIFIIISKIIFPVAVAFNWDFWEAGCSCSKAGFLRPVISPNNYLDLYYWTNVKMPLYLASSYKPKKSLDETGPVLVSSFHRWKVQLSAEERMVQRERSWKEHSNLPVFIQFSQCLNKKHKIIWFHLIFRAYFFWFISNMKSLECFIPGLHLQNYQLPLRCL